MLFLIIDVVLNLLKTIISNFLLEYVVFLMKYVVFLGLRGSTADGPGAACTIRAWGEKPLEAARARA